MARRGPRAPLRERAAVLNARRADPLLLPSARWGAPRGTVHRPIAIALDGDTAVVLERRDELTLSRWSLRDGALVSRAALGVWSLQGHCALARDGSRVAQLRGDGQVEVWDDPLRPPRAFALRQAARPAAFSPDGRRLVVWRDARLSSANAPLDLDVVDLATGVVESSLRGCNYVAWAPDGRSLVTDRDGLRQWPDGAAGPRSVKDAAFLPDGRVVTLSWTGDLALLRRDGDALRKESALPPAAGAPYLQRIVRADERAVVVTELAVRGERCAVWALSMADGAWRRLGRVDGRADLLASDGARVVAADGNALVCWDLATGAETRWRQGFAGPVSALAARGPSVAAHDGDVVRVFDAAALTEAWTLEGTSPRKRARPHGICFSDDGRSLFTANAVEGLVRWELATGAVVDTGPNVRSEPRQLVALPAGGLVARYDAGVLTRSPELRHIALHPQPRWVRWGPSDAPRRGCLDVRVDREGRLVALWRTPCQRVTYAPDTGAVVARSRTLTGTPWHGALTDDGSFAVTCTDAPDAAAYVAWAPADGGEPAFLGVSSEGARLLFANERLVVCDGEDWGLWRRDGARMTREATLANDGCLASELAFDEGSGALVVGTVEGTLLRFIIG